MIKKKIIGTSIISKSPKLAHKKLSLQKEKIYNKGTHIIQTNKHLNNFLGKQNLNIKNGKIKTIKYKGQNNRRCISPVLYTKNHNIFLTKNYFRSSLKENIIKKASRSIVVDKDENNKKPCKDIIILKLLKYIEIFKLLDSDGDGYISIDKICLYKCENSLLEMLSPILKKIQKYNKVMGFREFAIEIDKYIVLKYEENGQLVANSSTKKEDEQIRYSENSNVSSNIEDKNPFLASSINNQMNSIIEDNNKNAHIANKNSNITFNGQTQVSDCESVPLEYSISTFNNTNNQSTINNESTINNNSNTVRISNKITNNVNNISEITISEISDISD